MKEIKIIDDIMGKGKTSYMIQEINKNTTQKYIYITPFLLEVKRIKDDCANRKFYAPKNKGQGKLDNLHKLLLQGKNIVSTHALFRMANQTTIDLIKSNDYILVLDEVMDVIEEYKMGKDDIPDMLKLELITIENDYVVWNKDKEDYDGKYNEIKNLAKYNNLFYVNNTLLMWTFPAHVFQAFKEVFVLTYLFKAQIQRYYYDLFNLKYSYYYVEEKGDKNYEIYPKNNTYKEDKTNIRKNINISQNNKLNSVGDDKYNLSVTWFRNPKEDNDRNILIKQLQKNIYNYFRNIAETSATENMWTTFKIAKSKLKGKGYTKGFVPINCRATNEYRNKKSLAYCGNIFMRPIINNFFYKKGIKTEENIYALSELLQWIWRSAIRKNEKINLYIPSSRMRNLFIDWLKK